LVKNSFTLIETIISLVLVSIIISSFSKLLINFNSNTTYINLQKAQNEFTQYKKINSSFDEFNFVSHE